MKNKVIAFSAAGVLVISLIIIGTFKTGIVSALTATTTDGPSRVTRLPMSGRFHDMFAR